MMYNYIFKRPSSYIDLRKRIKDLEKQVKKCMAEKKSLSLRNDDPEFQRYSF